MDMIERVAHAIAFRHFLGKQRGGKDEDQAGYSAGKHWRDFVPHAREVLEVMREPTEAMLAAGMAEEGTDLKSEYIAMIDAALKDG